MKLKSIFVLFAALALCLPIFGQLVGNNHYLDISTSTTTNTLVSTAPLTQLHSVVVNSSDSGTVKIVDTNKADCSGGTTIAGSSDVTAGEILVFDVVTKNGLCVATGGTVDVTVTWK